MRSTIIGLFFGLILAVSLLLGIQQNQAVAGNSIQPEQKLIVFTSPSGEQVTMVDPERKVMSVYRVDQRTGQITLRSVRNVRWDFEIEDFNGATPTPNEIRSMARSR